MANMGGVETCRLPYWPWTLFTVELVSAVILFALAFASKGCIGYYILYQGSAPQCSALQ